MPITGTDEISLKILKAFKQRFYTQSVRKRIASFKQDAEKILNSLQQREEELQQLEESTNELLRKIKEETKFLRNYQKNIQNLLTKHLGVYDDKLVLAKRLDSNWQRSLKKKKILEYDELSYIWYVKDLDQLVEDYIKRTSRKKTVSYRMELREGKKEKSSLRCSFQSPLPIAHWIARGPKFISRDSGGTKKRNRRRAQ